MLVDEPEPEEETPLLDKNADEDEEGGGSPLLGSGPDELNAELDVSPLDEVASGPDELLDGTWSELLVISVDVEVPCAPEEALLLSPPNEDVTVALLGASSDVLLAAALLGGVTVVLLENVSALLEVVSALLDGVSTLLLDGVTVVLLENVSALLDGVSPPLLEGSVLLDVPEVALDDDTISMEEDGVCEVLDESG
jgi:hypothetical protein